MKYICLTCSHIFDEVHSFRGYCPKCADDSFVSLEYYNECQKINDHDDYLEDILEDE